MTIRKSLVYQGLSNFPYHRNSHFAPILRKIKYENALSQLHSLNTCNDLLCCISNVENAVFASNRAESWIIFASYNAIFDAELVDFYMNICYSILSTFEEGRICIGKS